MLLDRIARVPGLGHLAWAFTVRTFGLTARKEFPPHRRAKLLAEMKRNDPRACRRIISSYIDYLDRHGSLVSRLCESGARATVVFCENSRVGLTADERARLEACPTVTLVDVADSGHTVMVDQPARTAELVRELLP